MQSELIRIEASAGSGKTFSLTERFLGLLHKANFGSPAGSCAFTPDAELYWPEIVAVTFTNKAALEMKERIVTTLKKQALGGNEPTAQGWTAQQAERALTSILRRYQRLNVRTIDSLLSLISRIFALQLGISPSYELIFDEQELLAPALERLLEEARVPGSHSAAILEKAITTLVQHEESKGFWLADNIRERIVALTALMNTDQDIIRSQQDIADALVGPYDRLLQCKERLDALCAESRTKPKKYLLDALRKFEKFSILKPAPESKLFEKDSFIECVNKAGQSTITEEDEAVYTAFRKAYTTYQEHCAILSSAYGLAPCTRLATLFNSYEDQHGVQYDKLLMRTLYAKVNNALSEPFSVPEAWCRFGGRMLHLLIDEFQDTSRDQWHPILPLGNECLSKGGSFFYVGDVKQAIYGWRGGDATLFEEAIREPQLAGVSGTPQKRTLPNNWRSHRHVVEFNNDFFTTLAQPDFAVDLADAVMEDAPVEEKARLVMSISSVYAGARQEIPKKNEETQGYVRMELVRGEDREELEDHRKQLVLETLSELGERRQWKDIAILVRKNTQAEAVCDWLIANEIPVITEGTLRLSRHPIIRQLVALLSFLEYPLDDLAFAEFITGDELFLAETGFDKGQLYNWIARKRDKTLSASFREEFSDVWQRWIEPFIKQAGVSTPYDLVYECVRAFRATERHPDDILYIRRFLELVHLAEDNGRATLSTFLELWNEKGDEEKVPLPSNVDAVNIVTMHKSKGLEFPVVIMPYHDLATRMNNAADYAVTELEGKRYLVRQTRKTGAGWYEKQRTDILEQLNLLYVAWTRAEEELYAFTQLPNGRSKSSSVLNAIDLVFGDNFAQSDSIEFGVRPVAKASGPPAAKTPLAERALPAVASAPDLMGWLPRLRVYRHNIEEYSQTERLRGTAVHRAFELLDKNAMDEPALLRAAQTALSEQPSLEDMAETITTDILTMGRWIFNHPELSLHIQNGKPEAAILDEAGNTHIVDLLALSADRKEAVVVEYKTGAQSDEHITQVRRYLGLLSNMLPATASLRALVVYLDHQLILHVTPDATSLEGGR